MKTLRMLLTTTFFLLSFVAFAQATVLTFDDVDVVYYQKIANGYGGMNWENMYVLNTTNSKVAGSGYVNGTVSANNVAFNSGGALAMVSGDLFNFNGAYFTGAWNDALNIQIQGYRDGELIYDTTVITSAYNPQYFVFNYYGVDLLKFNSFGGTNVFNRTGTHFAMDNFTFTAVPEPASLLLLGIGLLGIAGLKRKK